MVWNDELAQYVWVIMTVPVCAPVTVTVVPEPEIGAIESSLDVQVSS